MANQQEKTLSKLQCEIIKLEEKFLKLSDKLEEEKIKTNLVELEYKQYRKKMESTLESRIKKEVEKEIKKVTEHYEKIIREKDQRIFELETRLNINSSNSSLPSSKNPLYQSKICNSRKETNKKKGGQKGHKKHKLEKFASEEITEICEHLKEECPNCHSHNIDVTNYKERDELDYEIKIIKRRHKFFEYTCKECGSKIKSEIPCHLHAENNYGANLKTFCATLTNYGFISYNRTRKIIRGMTDKEIDPSEGFITKLQRQASDKLSNFIFDVKEQILKSKLNYWDDTVIKIGEKDKACLRVYTNGLFVLYKAHIAKDTDGMNEDGILQNLPSDCIVMHDHLLHNYCDEYKYQNIECNAHIARKLEGITQNTKHDWSNEMKNLLENTLIKRYEYQEKKIDCFSEEFIKEFDNVYDSIIKKGLKEYKEFKHKYEFEREENLLEFMRDYKGPITEWIRNFNLPYSNNLCEGLLRMLKSKMKISYQFNSLAYAEYFANIMSYTETCGRFDINKVTALKRLFADNPYTVEELLALKKESAN